MAPQGRTETRVSSGGVTVDPLLTHILAERAIFPLFQPIVNLATRRIVAVEALARGPVGSALEFPDALFRAAADAQLLPEVDMLCLARALETAGDAGTAVPPLLFVNAEPAGFARPMTPDLLAALDLDREYRIVVEVTERALSAAPASLLHVAEAIHRYGNAVALDDVGADPISLAFMPLVEPEVVKLDMHLVRRPHDPGSLATTTVVSSFAERTGATVVAEGIETEVDLASALALGARWGQGWLFGRPGPLDAIIGRSIERGARLRPPQRELHRPTGTPFGLLAARNAVRPADERMIDAIVGQVLAQASNSGPHGVVLCAPNGPHWTAQWVRRLADVSPRVAFVGVLSARVLREYGEFQVAGLDHDDPIVGESAMAVLGPHTSVALCLRVAGNGNPDAIEFVLTHDRDLVQSVSRMIMQRLPR